MPPVIFTGTVFGLSTVFGQSHDEGLRVIGGIGHIDGLMQDCSNSVANTGVTAVMN